MAANPRGYRGLFRGRRMVAHRRRLAPGIGATHTRRVISELRERIARVLSLCVFVLTFGRVQVNPSGRPTASEPGRDDSPIAAKR